MKTNSKKLIFASLMAALCCVATFLIKIPLPGNGYVHIGDCFVILSGWLMGPYYGAMAAGIGSMLADIFAGFPIYVPATLVIKAISGAAAAVTLEFLRKKCKNTVLTCILSGILAGIIVPLGYFIYEYFLFGAAVAWIDVWGVAIKECAGIICASVIYLALKKRGLKYDGISK